METVDLYGITHICVVTQIDSDLPLDIAEQIVSYCRNFQYEKSTPEKILNFCNVIRDLIEPICESSLEFSLIRNENVLRVVFSTEERKLLQ